MPIYYLDICYYFVFSYNFLFLDHSSLSLNSAPPPLPQKPPPPALRGQMVPDSDDDWHPMSDGEMDKHGRPPLIQVYFYFEHQFDKISQISECIFFKNDFKEKYY